MEYFCTKHLKIVNINAKHMKSITEEIEKQNKELQNILIEWSSYLPDVRLQSIEEIIEQIRDILA